MASKSFQIDSNLTVTVFKRRGNKNLKLSLGHNGQVRVSIPVWAPYRAGVDFAKSRRQWIIDQQINPIVLKDGQAIGKAHHLKLVVSPNINKLSSRTSSTEIKINIPAGMNTDDPEVQKAAARACIRALRNQSEQLLPKRLLYLAEKYQFEYKSVSVKQLKSRWGSCDSQKNIVLNLFLMQLPWHLIDYVLLHELTHTKVLKHDSKFWSQMERVCPNSKLLKKELGSYKPALTSLA